MGYKVGYTYPYEPMLRASGEYVASFERFSSKYGADRCTVITRHDDGHVTRRIGGNIGVCWHDLTDKYPWPRALIDGHPVPESASTSVVYWEHTGWRKP